MNSLTTYWLCRTPEANPEGPFTVGQLRAMYGTGAINAEALVCLNGEQEWTEARWVLEEEASVGLSSVLDDRAAIAARMRHYEDELRREKKKNGTSGCTWGCLGLFVLFFIFGMVGSLLPKSKPSAAAQEQQAIRDSSAVKPSAWDGSVPEVKKFIQGSVRDPGSLKYNEWKNFTTSTNHITTVDFTATNGFGGPARETWVFSFDKSTGQLQTVFNGKAFLYDASGAEVK